MTADEVVLSGYELAAFEARCRAAVDTVQRDLDRTGLSQHRLQLAVHDDWPGRGACAYVGLPRGNVQGEFGGEYLHPAMDEIGLVEMAATNAIGSLLIIEQVRWPRCSEHPTKYMIAGDPKWYFSKAEGDDPGWWWCRTGPTAHPVSPIGELEPKQVVG